MAMTLNEIQESAELLSEKDRASLASFLIRSLPSPEYDVSDDEVAVRVRELESGEVEGISYEELKRNVKERREMKN